MSEEKFWLGFIEPQEYKFSTAYNMGFGGTTNPPQPDHLTDPVIGCRIIIGSYIHDHWCSTRVWGEAGYSRHWREALQRIVIDGNESSALLVSYRPFDTEKSEDTDWWTIVRRGDFCKFKLVNHTQGGFHLTHHMPITPDSLYTIVATDTLYRGEEENDTESLPCVPVLSIGRFLKELEEICTHKDDIGC